MTDYRTLALALHSLDAGHRDTVAGADQSYMSAVAAAECEVQNSDLVVRQAEASAHLARQHVAEIDERSSRLWLELATLRGRGGRRMGAVPPPATSPLGTRDAGWLDGTDADPLDIAAETITRWALGEPMAPVPRWMIVALPPAGALAALAVALPIRGVLALTSQRFFLINLIAEILLFFGPFAGVPALVAWTRHRYGARPDIGAIGMTALGGMISSCGLVLLLR